jgi:hypothetical protein
MLRPINVIKTKFIKTHWKDKEFRRWINFVYHVDSVYELVNSTHLSATLPDNKTYSYLIPIALFKPELTINNAKGMRVLSFNEVQSSESFESFIEGMNQNIVTAWESLGKNTPLLPSIKSGDNEGIIIEEML